MDDTPRDETEPGTPFKEIERTGIGIKKLKRQTASFYSKPELEDLEEMDSLKSEEGSSLFDETEGSE
jgi:hypothetical protein